MTIQQKIIKNKLGLIERSSYLQNISEACGIMGYSRDTFYRVKKAYEEGGLEALKEKSRKVPNHKNRIPEEVEQAVLNLTIEEPSLGQKRLSNTFRQRSIFISAPGVRCVWLRHGLEKFSKRLQALEESVAKTRAVLTESQLRALEKDKEEKIAWGEIETEHVGYLGAQDTFSVGTIKNVGRIYQQTFIVPMLPLALPNSTPARSPSTQPICSMTGLCRSLIVKFSIAHLKEEFIILTKIKNVS
jgi:hypothetical protein